MKKLIFILMISCSQEEVTPKFCFDCVRKVIASIGSNQAVAGQDTFQKCNVTDVQIKVMLDSMNYELQNPYRWQSVTCTKTK